MRSESSCKFPLTSSIGDMTCTSLVMSHIDPLCQLI